MLAWSIRAFASMDEVVEIVIAIDSAFTRDAGALLAEHAPASTVRVVPGGATRQDSVRNGITSVGGGVEGVLVHDGARPLVDPIDVRAAMLEVRSRRAAVLAVPVVDTVKLVDRATMRVERTLDRETLWAAQTPQLATLEDFRAAYALEDAATDDTSLLERIGVEVIVVHSRYPNFKVTMPNDVALAELLLQRRAS